MKKLLTLFLLLICEIGKGQNLVPNGDFETYISCPGGYNQLYNASPWQNPTGASPDYFNQCALSPIVDIPTNNAGYQTALSGDGYAGIYCYVDIPSTTSYREYLQVELNDTLIAQKNYCVSFYVNLANLDGFPYNNVAITEIGCLLSDSAISMIGYENFTYTPQITSAAGQYLNDTLNWMLVSANYVAIGGEKFITIGNFKRNINTDTMILNNKLSSSNMCYYYIDNVSVLDCAIDGVKENHLEEASVFPNPVCTTLHVKLESQEQAEIILYDHTSRKIVQKTFTHATTINTEGLTHGLYFYEVRNKKVILQKGKIMKDQ